MSCDSKDREFSIVIDINENYEFYRNRAMTDKNEFENKFVLFYTTWNDYGYYTLLVVRYFCENPDYENLGTIRICHDDLSGESEELLKIRHFLEKDYGQEVKIDKDNKLLDKYISKADSVLYNNLKKVFKNDGREIEFLSRLNEISTIKDNKRIENIKDVDWYKKSFIRYNEEIVAFTECKNILGITENSYVVEKCISIFLSKVDEILSILNGNSMRNCGKEIDIPAEFKRIMKEDKFKISDFLIELNKYSTITDKRKIEEIKKRLGYDKEIFASIEDKNHSNDNFNYFEKYISDVFNKIQTNISKLFEWIINPKLSYVEVKESLSFINLSNKLNGKQGEDLAEFRKKYLRYPELITNINEILGKLLEFYNNINIIKEVLKVEKNEVNQSNLKLGHYTSLETIRKLIKNKNKGEDGAYLRLTNGRQMNDPLEGKVLLDYILNRNKDSDKNTSSSDWEPTFWYVSSATTLLDSLPMWKQYGKDATGGMLVYDNNYLHEIMEKGKVKLYKVAYIEICEKNKDNIKVLKTDNITDEEVEKLERAISELRKLIEGIKNGSDETNKINSMIVLSDIAILFKKRDYVYENEYRIVIDREKDKDKIEEQVNPNAVFPFLYTYVKDIELKYSKLILGPKAIDIDYVAPYIHYCDEDITIQRSSISYR